MRALGSGGKLVICRKELLLEPAELLQLMRREQVDGAEFVPVVLRTLVQHLEETGQSLDFMRLVVVGSDAWFVGDHQRARRVLGPATRLINSYGLTETTIDSSYFEGEAAATISGLVPIGRPFPNVRLYVLDAGRAADSDRSARRVVHWWPGRGPRLRECRVERGAIPARPVRVGAGPACAARATGPAGVPTARWSSWAGRTTR